MLQNPVLEKGIVANWFDSQGVWLLKGGGGGGGSM